MDRMCLYRLIDISKQINLERRARCPLRHNLVGDLSQHGNWSCFRNEFFKKLPIEITADKFTPSPTVGILEFDFMSGSKPDVKAVAMLDRRFLALLASCNLIYKHEQMDKQYHLNYLKVLNENSNDADGTAIEHAIPKEKRMRIFFMMEHFNDSLKFRHAAHLASLEHEDTKVNYLAPITSDVPFVPFPPSRDASDDEDSPAITAKKGTHHKKHNRSNRDISPLKSQHKDAKDKKEVAKKDTPASSSTAPKISRKEARLAKLKAYEEAGRYFFEVDDPDLFEESKFNLVQGHEYLSVEERLYEKKLRKNAVRRRNFKKMIGHPQVSPYVKACKQSESLEDLLAVCYLTCRQVSLLMNCFRQGRLEKYSHKEIEKGKDKEKDKGSSSSKDGQVHTYGSFRVSLLIAIMHRIVDLNNFECIVNALEESEIAILTCRVGWFNGIFNPMKPEV